MRTKDGELYHTFRLSSQRRKKLWRFNGWRIYMHSSFTAFWFHIHRITGKANISWNICGSGWINYTMKAFHMICGNSWSREVNAIAQVMPTALICFFISSLSKFLVAKFQKPEPPEPWTGVLKAYKFGPRAPQVDFIWEKWTLGVGKDEDCLTLNVFSPAWKPPDDQVSPSY